MEVFSEIKFCKYCKEKLEISLKEGLECSECKSNVHLKCLRRGSVPGGLDGDIFFTFTCQECSPEKTEIFSRNKLSWLQVVVLVLYHLHNKSPGLARKGFFHWRHHIGKFIDKNWEILFSSENKKRKKWTGTIAGTLSHFSNYIFLSGNAVFNEPAVWALKYPKLTPYAISCIYSVMMTEKQQIKNEKQTLTPDADFFHEIVRSCIKREECLQVFTDTQIFCESKEDCDNNSLITEDVPKIVKQKKKRKSTLPHISKKLLKLSDRNSVMSDDSDDSNELPTTSSVDFVDKAQNAVPSSSKNDDRRVRKYRRLDMFCQYNTSLLHISSMTARTMRPRLTGDIMVQVITSPYSGRYLKPFIIKDEETVPPWLQLMAEIQVVANLKVPGYVLPPRDVLYYCWVQAGLIPAINSICNHAFWPGIDLTEALEYPEFSCVVLYKRLIVAFAFMIPNVKYGENYVSFIYTRPHWRNCGIASFMLYHLTQVSPGKDITLHVSMDNPALLLFQKFGFKTESVVPGFYEKYIRGERKESKSAFFCRLRKSKYAVLKVPENEYFLD